MRPERRQSPAGGARQRLRLVGAEEEDGVLVRGGFHGAVRDVIDLKGNPKHQQVRDSRDASSAPASGVGSGTRLEPSAAGKHPDGGPGYGSESLRDFYQRNGKDPAPRSCGQRGPCATPPGSVAGAQQGGRGRWTSGRRVRPGWRPHCQPDTPVFCAPGVWAVGRESLGVSRGCWGGLRGGGTLPQKASELKQRGCPGGSGSPGSHGEVQPSGVSSGPLSSPSPHGSTCQSLPIRGQSGNLPCPRLLPAEPPSTPQLSTSQSSSCSPGAPRHNTVTRPVAPAVPLPKRSSIPNNLPKAQQHPLIPHRERSQQPPAHVTPTVSPRCPQQGTEAQALQCSTELPSQHEFP